MSNIHSIPSIRAAQRQAQDDAVVLRQQFLSALRGWQSLEQNLLIATVIFGLSAGALGVVIPVGTGVASLVIASLSGLCGAGFGFSLIQANKTSGLMLSLDLGARLGSENAFSNRVARAAALTRLGAVFDREHTARESRSDKEAPAQILAFRRDKA